MLLDLEFVRRGYTLLDLGVCVLPCGKIDVV
jgi:hypothetical protein